MPRFTDASLRTGSARNLGAIIGGAIAGVAFLLILAAVWCITSKKGPKKQPDRSAGTRIQAGGASTGDNGITKRAKIGEFNTHDEQMLEDWKGSSKTGGKSTEKSPMESLPTIYVRDD